MLSERRPGGGGEGRRGVLQRASYLQHYLKVFVLQFSLVLFFSPTAVVSSPQSKPANTCLSLNFRGLGIRHSQWLCGSVARRGAVVGGGFSSRTVQDGCTLRESPDRPGTRCPRKSRSESGGGRQQLDSFFFFSQFFSSRTADGRKSGRSDHFGPT